mmetsp:Transcript_61246/g.177611  ORF Transcript_61246/g.177611 Transcript_61246/m.177611 type:complete len:137 (+) Transcript_61246:1-411(+)
MEDGKLLAGTSCQHDSAPPPVCDLPVKIYGAAMMIIVRSSFCNARSWHIVTCITFAARVLHFAMLLFTFHYTDKYIVTPTVNNVQKLYANFHDECFDAWGADLVFSPEKWADFEQSGGGIICVRLPCRSRRSLSSS